MAIAPSMVQKGMKVSCCIPKAGRSVPIADGVSSIVSSAPIFALAHYVMTVRGIALAVVGSRS